MNDGFKQVTKEEFDKFIKNYPNKLVWDVAGYFEPPLGSYNDFSNNKVWPGSMVAQINMYDGSDYYKGKTKEYFIKMDA